MTKDLLEEYTLILNQAKLAYRYCLKLPTRKEQAWYVLEHNRSGYRKIARVIFAMLRNKPYEEIILSLVKEKHRGEQNG